MTIRQCKLIAIEGPQGAGKTTLAYALTAEFKRRHVNAACVPEATRLSPFFEDTVFRGIPVDIFTEFHIFGSQITLEHEMARNYDLLFCDRTLVNVLAYSRILIDISPGSLSSRALLALHEFCHVYGELYDQIFFLSDQYDLALTNDPFRSDKTQFGETANAYRQHAVDALLITYKDVGLDLIHVPTGMELHEKVDWISSRISHF